MVATIISQGSDLIREVMMTVPVWSLPTGGAEYA